MKLKGFSKKMVVITVAAIAVVALIIYAATRKPAVEYELYEVDHGEVVEVISATGSIAPSSKIELQPEVSGKVAELAVKEGDEVKKGDLLIRLESGDINAQLLAQQASLASARARLAELEAGATAQELLIAESAVQTAEARLTASETAKLDAVLALENANKNLDNTRAKAETQKELKLTQFLSDMENAYNTSNDAVNRLTDPLFNSQNFMTISVSSSQAESDAVGSRSSAKSALPYIETAWRAAAASATEENITAQSMAMMPHLISVKIHLDNVVTALNYSIGLDSTVQSTYRLNASTALSGVTAAIQALDNDSSGLVLQDRLSEAEIISAEIVVSNAQTALNAADNVIRTNERLLLETQASLELRRTGTRQEIITSQRALVSAESARLAGLQNEAQKRRLVAPADSTVTQISAEVGETVSPSQTAVLLNAKGNFEVTANISEIDIARLTVGDSVEITLDAFSDEDIWTGTVVAIRPAETVIDSVIFYKTTIRFDVEDERLRSGMTANLDIETDRQDSTLRIPVRALRQRNGDTFVEVMGGDGAITEVDVTIGLETDDYLEVLSGVSAGDSVVVYTSAK
ncbi:MAG: efflux RND transporter periplasmic adaptor subunit [Patescibacteria group bacterium]